MKIKVSREDLKKAAESNFISAEQVDSLWSHLSADSKDTSEKATFTGVNVAFYFGAFIIISAMTWFATEAFASFSSLGLMIISLVYFAGFSQVGKKLYKNKTTRIPGGLLLTIAVFMVPMFIFSCQHYAGIWGTEEPGNYRDYFEWIKSGWFFMEIGTIITAIIFLYKFRFPFLTFPLAFTLWFLSMDLTAMIYGDTTFTGRQRETVSMISGLVMLIIAYFIDRKTEKDYAFWLYLFGLLAFWGGLSLMGSGSEYGKFIYFCINIGLIIISILFRRKVFLVFGAIGSFGYLGYLSMEVFGGSLIFPLVMTILGLLIIFLGVAYAKNQEKIEELISSILPNGLLKLLPPNRN